jgi:hypothetical protein
MSSVDNTRTEMPFVVLEHPARKWIIGLTTFEMKGIRKC